VTPPSKQTTAGRAFLDLRRLAQSTGRTTDELLQLYVLEGFLDRLTRSEQRDHFVLKGGVLLAAYQARRATRDIDFAARQIANDTDTMIEAVRAIFTVDLDDGLTYNPESLRAQIIREDDDYSGVRITATAGLATAKLHFHLDINVGDPIWPEPTMVSLPRLLGTEPIRLIGYPVAMILAEKIVTAVQRGTANTRWRDFVDINALLAASPPDPDELRSSIRRVAEHREASIRPLTQVLDGYAAIAQPRWSAWRRNQRLESTTPATFSDLIQTVIAYADPLLT
jgi:predicted nucleotidyltransferase component of viral defense system